MQFLMRGLAALALLCVPAFAQFPPTLARSGPMTEGTFETPWVAAEAELHGGGAEALLCVLPASAEPIEVTWEISEGQVYHYANWTWHDLGVQNGATAALHYLRAGDEIVDGIGSWDGWDNHYCGPFGEHYGAEVTEGAHVLQVIVPPSAHARALVYVLGADCASSTWPIGHGYPLHFKAGGRVRGWWRACPIT